MLKVPQGLKKYFEGVRLEFRKISWPQRQILRQLTFFVLVLIIILALFAGIIDTLFSKLIQIILK